MPPELADLRRVRQAYDTVAEELAAVLPDTRAEAPLDLAVVDAFSAAVTAGTDPRVLDAGCGSGRMSRYLADRGCRVEGIDLSHGMVSQARRDHPDLPFAVASLTDLPYTDDQFEGVLLWYSIIHTPPELLGRVVAEAKRVVRPGGHVLVGFQAGSGTRPLTFFYSRFRDQLSLHRHLHDADDVASHLSKAGLHEQCRMVRRPQGNERDDQAFLLARAG